MWVGLRARSRLKRLATLSNHSPFQINERSTSVDEKMIEYLQTNYGADGMQSNSQSSTSVNESLSKRGSFYSTSSRQPSLRRSLRRSETEKSCFEYIFLDGATKPEQEDATSSASSVSCEAPRLDLVRGAASPRADSADMAIAHVGIISQEVRRPITAQGFHLPDDLDSKPLSSGGPLDHSTRLKELAFRMPSWNFDIFEVQALAPRPLSFIGFVCLDAYSKLVDFEKPKLLEFLNDIESRYRSVPYHNSLHGACVARMVYSFCTGCGLSFSQENMEFTLVLAGLVHDVGHPGLSTQFLINASVGGRPWRAPLAPPLESADMELASKYNDQSPLENMHCAVTFELLRRDKNAFLRSDDVTSMRKPLIRAILGTDMAKHAEQMTRLVALIDNLEHDTGGLPWYWPATPPAGSNEEQRRAWQLRVQEEFVMELFLHAADLGNATLPFTQWCKWNRLIQQEFHCQGDRELQEFGELISAPAGYDRHASAVTERNFTKGFMEHLVKPFFDRLGDLTAISAAGCVAGGVNIQCCLGNLRRNLRYWEERTSWERGEARPLDSRGRCKSEGDQDARPWDDASLAGRGQRAVRRSGPPLGRHETG